MQLLEACFGLGSQMEGVECKVLSVGCRVSGLGFGIKDLRFWVDGWGIRV